MVKAEAFKIKQKLITVTPLDITLQNETGNNIILECEETQDGVKPKLLIKIKKFIKRRNKK